jgi:hypothetical protein
MSASVSEVLNTLTEMGFSEARAKKALTNTQWNGVEAAMEWVSARLYVARESVGMLKNRIQWRKTSNISVTMHIN